jgi:short-subunit dehydrogenase
MAHPLRPLAVVTGASTGIGYELAKCCARAGFDLLIVADEPRIHAAATEMEVLGARTMSIEADLATMAGVERLIEAIGERDVDALIANAGRGLGHAFLEQDLAQIRHVIDTNVTGTVALVHKVGRDMQQRGKGRILVTGSIAGFVPGTYHAVYNATKAFI